ncbi:hypothetical protein GUJ93_ZPchr0012g21852 [Zizania palustris]|uniref:Cystatin domain-containing protein n=1 Tax=Zizania palustris TaxID=103762 RepID=A0A8J5WP77_ZIZPA|nr:hypothetical protein GUJ93_ZPchr0012g21852 [Zizania palustris]
MASARGLLLVAVAVAAFPFSCAAGAVAPSSATRRLLRAPGGLWTPVPDARDPHIQELGRWAVRTHDRLDGDHLVFRHVSRAEIQGGAGVDNRLHLKAAGGDPSSGTSFVAVVWESAFSGTRTLLSFDRE